MKYLTDLNDLTIHDVKPVRNHPRAKTKACFPEEPKIHDAPTRFTTGPQTNCKKIGTARRPLRKGISVSQVKT